MDLLKVIIGISVGLLILAMIKRENFTETFGFSGYKKPIDYVKLNDPRPDMSGYSQIEAKVDHDTMEQLVLQTNKELNKRLGFSTYIIETQSVKVYEGTTGQLYEATFMVVRNDGFSSASQLLPLSKSVVRSLSWRLSAPSLSVTRLW